MQLKIEYIPIGKLKPYERNNKKHIDEIAKSIKKYGFNEPIGIWKDNIIIVGHGRLEACKKLGITEVPCVRLDHLTDKQRREYAIMHNKTSELAEYDFDNLKLELDDLDLSDFDIDFDIDDENVSPDEFGEDFQLANGDKPEICQMTFTLHEKQKELIDYALNITKENISETFGNTNNNGNALYEVIKEWAEQRK